MALSNQFEELRRRAKSRLALSGSIPEIRADVTAMAEVGLPLSKRYQHINAEKMVLENAVGQTKHEVVECFARLLKAVSILEKYGCNLTNPNRPKYWRSVKHNNPVFRTTVDAVKGGREVLSLYGYTNQLPDGLSFPDDVTEPDVKRVAEVTVEVMMLRTELDMLVKAVHPHPEFFETIIPALQGQHNSEEVMIDACVILPKSPPLQPKIQPKSIPSPPAQLVVQPDPPQGPSLRPHQVCDMCGGTSTLLCSSCNSRPFCDACDALYHRHPDRASHRRDRVQENCSICGVSPVSDHCVSCCQHLCTECDLLYHSHPSRREHKRQKINSTPQLKALSYSLSTWECVRCTTVNGGQAVLCATCECPRLASAAPAGPEESLQASTISEWQCRSCTVVNPGGSVLCTVCERPRLATRPSVSPSRPLPAPPTTTTPPVLLGENEWMCEHCTFANSSPSGVCEMCNLPRQEPRKSHKPLPLTPNNTNTTASKPKPKPRSMHLQMQKMKEEGQKLVSHIREGEKRGMTPEEVYAALCVSSNSNVNPCDWIASELPHLLDEICAMAVSVQQTQGNGDPAVEQRKGASDLSSGVAAGERRGEVQLSRAEAKQAWLTAGGDTEKAVRQLLRSRQAKMQELHSLGFQSRAQCESALRQSGGDIRGALSVLQRPLLEPFHQRVWSTLPEAPIDLDNPDKQRMCRRLLALYDLPSWGRCELALSLLQEPEMDYSLEDVVQAVKESHDRDFIRRMLNNSCTMCYSNFPLNKMQSLTSCQCLMCSECFTRHFTIAIRDKHIRDMVCPNCEEPDINDPEHLDNYFSTLDIQLRDCLARDVFDLFHKRLTEHALMQDPKFLWCTHCTNGFINDGIQFKVTCLSCQKSFCAQCKKPWEDQHDGVSCEAFQAWKRENDPEYQRQGLAGYLRDNGIICPNCRYQYALTRGGCMHFTCTQCRYEFCSGCNNPFHKTGCTVIQCSVTGLHAHHPRDCLFYLRDWEPKRLQELLQRNGVEFNTNPPNGTQAGTCGVMEQKDEGGQHMDSPCGSQAQPGQAGLCEKHYREYLVSLINSHTLDPAHLFDETELKAACMRHQIDLTQEAEDQRVYHARLLQVTIVCVDWRFSYMPSGIRSTRRLRTWMVEQVSSGKYPGLVWDDTNKTMFRIPWKHAGKQDFRSEEDAAIFKAWAEFKGKLTEAGRTDPASWKTRLRCALNKSPEFSEVTERSQLDISEPYKVYRLVPISEQGCVNTKPDQAKAHPERRRKRRNHWDSEEEEELSAKMIKEEHSAVQQINMMQQLEVEVSELSTQVVEVTEPAVSLKNDGPREIQLNVTIATSPPPSTAPHSFLVSVQYLGKEVLKHEVRGSDVRITYMPVAPVPPSPQTTFPRIPLPDPPVSMASEPAMQAISTLLPFMERGVVLTSTGGGVYAKRYCQGRVFWRGPHTDAPDSVNKMERTAEPVMVFSREAFREQLQDYQTNGGPVPQSSIIMCFGEELFGSDDSATKLIIVKISFPWAEQQIKEVDTIKESVSILENFGEVTLNLIQIP
ncbi:interferon regulatory factor 9 [Sardina pilchardus]|uniref:interferon regulatory factor 9 n=1 Tax=Sardina pilchardus TaxID=27697 RepID=UPI002E0FFE58